MGAHAVTTDSDSARQLRVTFRRVRSERTDDARVLAVFCPRRTRAVALKECRGCEHCRGLCVDETDRETFLRCTWSTAAGTPEATESGSDRRRARPTPAVEPRSARETLLEEVMTTPVQCVTPETPIEDLTRIFLSRGISAVPVVDDGQRAIGLVSKTDLLQRYYEAGDAEGEAAVELQGAIHYPVDLGGFDRDHIKSATVRDVMTHHVFSLMRDASLSRAAALMSYEGVHRIVVTAADGRPLGVVASLDILRWIAQQDGYVMPPSRPTAAPEQTGDHAATRADAAAEER